MGGNTVGLINPWAPNVIGAVNTSNTKIIMFFEHDDPNAKTPAELIAEARFLKQREVENARYLEKQKIADNREELKKKLADNRVLRDEKRLNQLREKILWSMASRGMKKKLSEKPNEPSNIELAQWLDEKEDKRLAKLASKHLR